jgi:hypothetical protein
MPRFFLHMRNDDVIEDREGLFLEDADQARREAIRSARDIIAEDVRHGWVRLTGAIEVADENGQPILTVPFRQAVEIEA